MKKDRFMFYESVTQQRDELGFVGGPPRADVLDLFRVLY